MNLSDHFTLKELTASQVGTRHRIEEQFNPPGEVIENLMYLSKHVLEPIRVQFGAFRPTSAYRCPAVNHLVNGSLNSLHLYGCAADIDFGHVPANKMLFNWIKSNLPFTELIDEYNFSWVHVGIIKGRENERKIKVIK